MSQTQNKLYYILIFWLVFGAYPQRGSAHGILGSVQNAQQLKAQALSFFPQLKTGMTDRNALSLSNHADTILDQIDTLIAADTSNPFGNPYLILLKGFALVEKDKTAEAEVAFNQALLAARDEKAIHWDLARLLDANDLTEQADNELKALYQLNLSQGIHIDPILFSLGIQTGNAYSQADEPEMTARYFEFAKKMDPTSPLPYLKLARVLIGSEFSSAFTNFVKCFSTLKSNFLLQLSLAHSVLQIVLYGLYLGLLMAVLLFTVRNLSKYQYLILEALPAKAAQSIREFGAWVLILSPLILGLGATAYALLGIALTWYYYERVEKVVAAVFLGFLLILPGLFAKNYAMYVALSPNSPVSLIWKGQNWDYDPAVFSGLQAYTADEHLGPYINLTLGLMQKRQGAMLLGGVEDVELSPAQIEFLQTEHAKGRQEMQGAIDYFKKTDEPYHSAALNNIGNIYFAEQEYRHAIDKYDEAAKVNPLLAESFLNMGQTYFRLKRMDSGREMQEKAIALDPLLVNYLKNVDAHPNRAVIDKLILDGDYWKLIWARKAPDASAFDPLWIGGINGLSVAHIPIAVIACIIFIFIVNAWRRRVDDMSVCSITGTVLSLKSCRKFKGSPISQKCFSAIAGTKLDAMKFALLARMKRSAEKQRFVFSILLCILYPGLGQLYQRMFGWGLPIIFLATFTSSAFLLAWFRFGIQPTLYAALPMTLSVVTLVLLTCVIYFLNFFSIMLARPAQVSAQDIQDEMQTTEGEL